MHDHELTMIIVCVRIQQLQQLLYPVVTDSAEFYILRSSDIQHI
jgi:hypothetical protein